MESDKGTTSMEIEKVQSDANRVSSALKPNFEPLKAHEISDGQVQFRKVSVPPHRYTPLKKAWMEIYGPVYDQMKVDIRMNLKGRKVELKTRSDTPDISNLQKSADFVHAFMLGFDVIDAVALLRLDELYVESFEIKDVKTLRGEHLSRAIGRLSGKGGLNMESDKGTTSMEIEKVQSDANRVSSALKPNFEPLKAHEISDGQVQFRKVSVPPHRYTPLKKAWMEIYGPVYDQMKVDIRMNLKGRKVELKTRSDTPDISNLQKSADFVHAFMLGFDVIDAVALLRLDELYVESFEIKDVKTLRGEHLSRAIGRLSGKGGKTKFAIENSTKTRIVIADTKIHILGSFANIKIARDSLCSLILGSPAGKVKPLGEDHDASSASGTSSNTGAVVNELAAEDMAVELYNLQLQMMMTSFKPI
uniref:K Homology domain-containing protein n=1 Tax=Daucus carota subsp. sativus TaxID=79200 RepID=A0A161ZID4_DAUCS